jgi:hypothetical protein
MGNLHNETGIYFRDGREALGTYPAVLVRRSSRPENSEPLVTQQSGGVAAEDPLHPILRQSGQFMTVPAVGMGTQSVGFVVNNAVIGHAFSHCGEISAVKGVQGKKGYPS